MQMGQNVIMDNGINPPPIESYSFNRKQDIHGPYMSNIKSQQNIYNTKPQQIPAPIEMQKSKIQMPMQLQQQKQQQGFQFAASGQPFSNRQQMLQMQPNLLRNPIVSKNVQPQLLEIQQFQSYGQNLAQITKKN